MPSPSDSPQTPRSARRILRRILLCGLLVFAVLFVLPLGWWRLTAADYDGYNYFSFGQIEPDPRFIAAGAAFPADAEVYTPTGAAVRIGELWAERPLVLETGSRSCPIYWDSNVSMGSLAADYGERARFAVLYTREAHPGLFARPHKTLDDKLAQAAALDRDLERSVWVDAVDGALHQRMGGAPNAVYVIGTDGIVAHYAYWNQPARTGEALAALLAAGGRGAAVVPSQFPCPDLRRGGERPANIGRMTAGIARVGGPDALVDFMAAMPRMARQGHPHCGGSPDGS